MHPVTTTYLAALASFPLALTSCASSYSAKPPMLDGNMVYVGETAENNDGLVAIEFRRMAVSDCCSLEIPKGATQTINRPIDSIATGMFTYGSTRINYDLTGRNGLGALPKTVISRSQTKEGVAGFIHSLAAPAKVSDRNAVFSVTVICQDLECPIADRMLGSVQIDGKAISIDDETK